MVVHVMNAVCLLLGQPTDWKTAKQLTRDGTAFLKLLYSYDKENVPDKVSVHGIVYFCITYSNYMYVHVDSCDK